MTITDTTRSIITERLDIARREQATLDAERARLERELDDVLARLSTTSRTVQDIENDLLLDEPIPFTVDGQDAEQ